MGADFWQSVGGAFQQVPGRAANVAGLGVDALTTLNALASRDPTALIRLQAAQAQALQDPTLRARAAESPFFGGLLGGVAHTQPGLPVPGPAGPTRLAVNLPPLSATTQAQFDLQRQAIEAAQRPGAVVELPLPGGGRVRTGSVPARGTMRPGEIEVVDPATGLVFAVDPATGERRVLGKREIDPARRARATAEAQADASAQAAGFRDRNDPQYRAAVGRLLGLSAPSAPSRPGAPLPITPQTPETPPAAAAPAPSAGKLPADDTPLGRLVPTLIPRPEGSIGFPSPAFVDQPQRPAAPTALPTPPALPAGTTATLSGGRLSISRRGVPAPGRAVPAIESRQLSLLTSASQAARQALQILQRGPQSPLTVGGVSVGRPPTFAGPVSGRALGALATVSGQPLAQEDAQLAALIAHASSGITALTGLRFTEQQLKLFDPLMPKLSQPTEVLAVHLSRLSRFYDSLAAQQEALANLSPEQRQAATLALFQTTITGLDEPPGSAGPVVRDLR